MTYREKLILFMEKKSKKIKSKKAILNWSEEKAKEIWNFIKKQIYQEKDEDYVLSVFFILDKSVIKEIEEKEKFNHPIQ